MDSFAILDEVLFRSKLPIIFQSAFYSLVCICAQPTTIYSVPVSPRHWGCCSGGNKNPCPDESYFVVLETNYEQVKKCGDGFVGNNKAEVRSFVKGERHNFSFIFGVGWSENILKRISAFAGRPEGGGRETDHADVGWGEGTAEPLCRMAWHRGQCDWSGGMRGVRESQQDPGWMCVAGGLRNVPVSPSWLSWFHLFPVRWLKGGYPVTEIWSSQVTVALTCSWEFRFPRLPRLNLFSW